MSWRPDAEVAIPLTLYVSYEGNRTVSTRRAWSLRSAPILLLNVPTFLFIPDDYQEK